jgi:hypothetical protein
MHCKNYRAVNESERSFFSEEAALGSGNHLPDIHSGIDGERNGSRNQPTQLYYRIESASSLEEFQKIHGSVTSREVYAL